MILGNNCRTSTLPLSQLVIRSIMRTRADYRMLLTKYENLFNSVPTSVSEVDKLHNVLANNILFDIVRFCVRKLKPHKDDGKYGFKSVHLINGTNKQFTVLSFLFNAMLTHGFNPGDLLRSTIISMPKDSRGHDVFK